MKKINRKKGGFTLIELLVVIAIIGILSSVVLVSLNSARNKGQDARIQEQIASTRSAAEIYYTGNGNSYAGIEGITSSAGDFGSGLYTLTKVAGTWPVGGLPSVNSKSTAWVISHPLASVTTGNFISCADSTGFAGLVAATSSSIMCDGSTY